MESAVKEFEYSRGNLLLTAYSPKVGLLQEDALIHLYKRLKEEGLWDIVFHESHDLSMLEFMNYFSKPTCLLQILCIVKDGVIVDFAGMAWVSEISTCAGAMTRALGSFLFFKLYQKPMYTDQFAEIILGYWFEKLGLDVIVGVTPEPNRAALVYVKRAGFTEVGRIPGYTTFNGEAVSAVITAMTKQQYKALSGG
jgi:RimJ/RimL family protein N-acetyltransferase